MSYFDSNKNKALWEKEMTYLRQEKQRRQVEGFKPGNTAEAVKTSAARPGRRRINLAELERIERMSQGAASQTKAPRRRRQRNMEKQAPTLNAPAAPSMGSQ